MYEAERVSWWNIVSLLLAIAVRLFECIALDWKYMSGTQLK